MTSEQHDHEPTTDPTPAGDVPGTEGGNPIAGVEIDEAEVEQAVEPDDNAFEVDGPQAGHA